MSRTTDDTTMPIQAAPREHVTPSPYREERIRDRDREPRRRRGLGGGVAVVLCLLFLIVGAGIGWFGDQVRDFVSPEKPAPDVGDVALLEIRQTSELRAATGSYSVPVYFGLEQEEGFAAYVPDFIDGESGVAIYQGSVDALIDLSALTAADVVTDEEASTLELTVPEPVLTEPNIDESESQVAAHDRGFLVRMSDFFEENPTSMREDLDEAAVAGIAEAAEDSDLAGSAQESGRDFLTALGHRLGYDTVTVSYR